MVNAIGQKLNRIVHGARAQLNLIASVRRQSCCTDGFPVRVTRRARASASAFSCAPTCSNVFFVTDTLPRENVSLRSVMVRLGRAKEKCPSAFEPNPLPVQQLKGANVLCAFAQLVADGLNVPLHVPSRESKIVRVRIVVVWGVVGLLLHANISAQRVAYVLHFDSQLCERVRDASGRVEPVGRQECERSSLSPSLIADC